MNYKIENEKLSVTISSKGAELQNIIGPDGTEYLWQGDVRYWTSRATNIFPYVGRLTDDKYLLDGRSFSMDIHGFVRKKDVHAYQHSEKSIAFFLEDDEETLKTYPFPFSFTVIYTLKENLISIEYVVKNKGPDKMYFGLGGHPGFNVPLCAGEVFEDYYIDFPGAEGISRVNTSYNCQPAGGTSAFELRDGRYLDLRHDLFDNDAIVLTGMGDAATLVSRHGGKSITVSFPDMDYIGLWQRPHTRAPYICIEPWTSLASREGIVEDLAKQENLIRLEPGATYRNTWAISVILNP